MPQKKGCRTVPTHGTRYYRLCGSRLRCYICYKKHQTKGVLTRVHKLKKLAVEFKGGKCKRCGYKRYIGALEFHHRDPTKKDVSGKQLMRRSWARIKQELMKCDLLCANCHREIHAQLRLK